MANAVISIMGRLVADPESRHTTRGTEMVKCRVAVQQGWGEKKSTGWYGVTAFGHSVKFLRDFCRKGDEVWVTGELEVREVEGDVGRKMFLDITASNVAKTNGSKRQDGGGFGSAGDGGDSASGDAPPSDIPF